MFEGINRVGVSIASPLYETKPLFSLIAAVWILNEKLTGMVVLDVLFMLIGTITISSEKSGGEIEKVTGKIVLGAILIVAATIILTMIS